MKNFMPIITIITFLIFLIDWGILLLKLLDNNYNITTEAYIGVVCIIIIFVCAIHKFFSNKCPYCKKIIQTNAIFCSHCGMKLK